MAAYNDAAYDDNLADDWETQMEVDDEKEKAALAAEEERKEQAKGKKPKKAADDEENANGEAQEGADGTGVGEMLSKAHDAESAGELLGAGSQNTRLAQRKLLTPADYQTFSDDLVKRLIEHQASSHYRAVFPGMLKVACEKLSVDELNQILRKVNVAANAKKAAETSSAKTTTSVSGRGRNADMDAFAGVTDRGGAADTDDQNFM